MIQNLGLAALGAALGAGARMLLKRAIPWFAEQFTLKNIRNSLVLNELVNQGEKLVDSYADEDNNVNIFGKKVPAENIKLGMNIGTDSIALARSASPWLAKLGAWEYTPSIIGHGARYFSRLPADGFTSSLVNGILTIPELGDFLDRHSKEANDVYITEATPQLLQNDERTLDLIRPTAVTTMNVRDVVKNVGQVIDKYTSLEGLTNTLADLAKANPAYAADNEE